MRYTGNTATAKTTEAGNTIYTSDYTGKELVFIGNDGYESDRWGKFTIQTLDSDGLWNEVENGIVDTEAEAVECVQSLIDSGYVTAEEIGYTQI